VTTTIDPAEDVADDAHPVGSPRAALKPALAIALATALLLAALAGVVFVFLHKVPPTPAPVVQQALAAPAPSATPAPDEQFLNAWHEVAPGVAARRSDNTWLQIGVSTCHLIGIPGATPDVISRVLGSNPDLMSVAEGNEFLGVANAKLCPEKAYVAGPTLVLPNLVIPGLPDFSGLTVPHVSAPSIPTVHVSPPSVHVPSIPGTGSSGSSSSSSSSSGGHTPTAPSIIKPPLPGGVHTEN
jgi:hypothetical protein